MRLTSTILRRSASMTGRVLLLAGIFVFPAASLLFSQSRPDQPSQIPTAPQQPPQGQNGPPAIPDLSPPPLTPKQQRELLKASYQKLKQETDDLVSLAKSLQEELNKSNQNVLSLQVVAKAERIEKLAKKIKSEAMH